MKKVLILTVTAGNGHNAAAQAIKNKLESVGNYEVMVVDMIKEYSSSLNSWTIDRGYALSVEYLLPVYNFFYNKYLKYDSKKVAVAPVQTSVKSVNGKLLKTIYEFQPDVIFATSYYCSMALANLRRVYKLPSVNMACMLDYVVSPFWEASLGGIEYLTITHEDFRQELIERGFSNKNLIYTGLPVGEKFLQHIDKAEAREKIGIDKNTFTVLIFFGGGCWGGGYSALKNIVKNFKKKIQIIMVNGRDEKTKNKIDKEMKSYPSNISVKNYGFSKEIDLLMSASDVMIGKGGGLCTTETINKTLPLIATENLPGQEYYNIKFLEKKGTALSFANKKKMIENLDYVYENPQKLSEMRETLKTMRTDGIGEIFNLIDKQPYADYSMINTKLDYERVNKIVKRARKNSVKK